MTKSLNLLTGLLLLGLATGCSDDYDDSSLWKDIDQIYKDIDALRERITSLNGQLELVDQVLNGSPITSIAQDAEGNYIIRYKGSDNVEHTVTVATQSQMPSAPILGIQKEGNIWYWTQTADGKTTFLKDKDGSKVPVDGRTPQLSVDDAGYWMVNGVRITDANGNPIKSEGKQASLITGVTAESDGTVSLTLADGTTVKAQLFNAFNLTFSVETTTAIDDPSTPIVVNYQIVGEKAADAMIEITKTDGLTAELNTTAKTITVTFPSDFEKGGLMVMLYDGADNVIIKPLYFEVKTDGSRGISSAADLLAFANAVNAGGSIAKYRDESGAVVLNNDIDMAGVTAWTPIGMASGSTTTANTTVNYTVNHAFDAVFDGKGYTIKNIAWQFDAADGGLVYGLFGAIAEGAEVRNLTLDGTITVSGAAPQGLAVGALVGYADAGTVTNVTNKASIHFAGSDAANTSIRLGGIAGVINNAVIGGDDASSRCTNDGAITCGSIVNTASGANSAVHSGGIVGFIQSGATAAVVKNCTNNGAQSVPSGRGGGLVGTAVTGTISSCSNNGFIQDDVNGVFASNSARYNVKRMGGLVGGMSSGAVLENSVNNGNVFSQNGCRTGGFVGHNEGTIDGCTNYGVILSDHVTVGSNYHGSGWACGYNKNASGIVNCVAGGRVGDYSVYANAPETAPEADFTNAVVHGNFTAENNGLVNTSDTYYEWEVDGSPLTLADGVTYTKYSFKHINQHIFVIEADLTNPNVELTTVISDDLAPNPNNNNNSNNGKNLRETLSETCVRRRAEGQNIIAGINTGFFDSTNGIPRGFHIEEGEPVFINNPDVRAKLTNHKPGFTMFADRTVSFGNRDFKGLLKVGGEEFEFYSVNDTITRLNDTYYDANLYTHHLSHTPHAGIEVNVGSKALFIKGHVDGLLQINKGYLDATVTEVIDGRNDASVTAPYVTGKGDWVLQVTGEKADKLKALVAAGASVQISTAVTIGGDSSKAITTHNSSMYRFLSNGAYGSYPSADEKYPATVAGMDQTGTKMFWVAVDGKTTSDIGLTYYELYRTCKKLGAYNMIRFDGGGSTTMWIYEGGNGRVVNTPCDSKGERSCMNYFHLRVKQ